MDAVLTALIGTSLFLVLNFIRIKIWKPLTYWQRKKFPYKPGAVPFFGHVWGRWWKDYLTEDLRDVETYGKVFGVYEGMCPTMLIADPDLAKEILITKFEQFVDRRELMEQSYRGKGQYFRKVMFTLRGNEWKIMRGITSPFFSTARMRQLSSVVGQCVDDMMIRLQEKLKQDPNNCFDVKFAYLSLTMDVILRTVYGIKYPDIGEPTCAPMKHAMKLFSRFASPIVMLATLFPKSIYTFMDIGLKALDLECIDYFADIATDVLKNRKREGFGKEFLELLLEARQIEEATGSLSKYIMKFANKDDPSLSGATNGSTTDVKKHPVKIMTEDMILGNVFMWMIAGFETTSSLLALSTYLLGQNPECQEKLYREVKEKLAAYGEISHDMLLSCDYLDATVNETLRLYPPLERLERFADVDTTLGNMKIQKGQFLMISVIALQRSEEYFKNPDKFDPDRWIGERKKEIRPFTWMPFGLGNRNCLGMRFAQEEAKLAIAKILLRFKIIPDAQQRPLEFTRTAFVVTPKTCRARFVPRDK